MKALTLVWFSLLASCAGAPSKPPMAVPLENGAARTTAPGCSFAPPEVPSEAIRQGISGTVVAEARVVNNVVTSVQIVSGPEIFHESIVLAMKGYKCSGFQDSLVRQEFRYDIEPPVPQAPVAR